MVLELFSGYNVTILAYGQTGSGKTHTMGKSFNRNSNDGIIPRAVEEIFDMIAAMTGDMCTVNCSFVELYMNKFYDLLSTNSRDQSIVDVHEDNGKIFIRKATKTLIKNVEQAMKCFEDGSKKRAVSGTAMNAQSSRSHAIFKIIVQKTPKNDPNSATTAEFLLVDLAGSLRANKAMTADLRLKEGASINQDLTSLGIVISALSNRKNGHINYRDSKLTWVLRDCLGGNSLTLMIACVSPSGNDRGETINTLEYAERAKKIKNELVVNKDPTGASNYRLMTCLNENMVLISSNVGDKQSLDRLIEARDQLIRRRNMVQEQTPPNQVLIDQINDDIEFRDGQIAELKGKINATDINARIDTTADSCQDLAESTRLVKMLFDRFTDQARELEEQKISNALLSQELKTTRQ